jgi:hypothetical protein
LTFRGHVLAAATGLVVAFVRTFLQYHRYGWESLYQFSIAWLVHYVAVILFVIVSSAVVSASVNFFSEPRIDQRELSADRVMVYVLLVVLVAAVFIFIVAHWPSPDLDLYEE